MWGILGHALQPVLGVASSIPAIKYRPEPVMLAKPRAPYPPTSKGEIDQAIKQLNAAGWVATTPAERARLVDQVMWNLVHRSQEVARLSAQAKGTYGLGLGEELVCMFPVILALKEYALDLKAGGERRPMSVHKLPGTDQLAAQVFPWGMLGALMPGTVGEVWIEPGKPASQGALYRRKAAGEQGTGGVAAVLGAGNQYPVVLLDIFHKLLVDDEVVCCKMSPVNEYLGPIFSEALAPLIDHKALSIIYGGREEGAYLVSHAGVDSVHLTGATDTCNAIVWGSPNAPRTGTPVCTKHVTAELGNVTPYIIVPGPWSDDDIVFHVKGVISGLTHNASHNCLAAEVLVTDASWPLRDKFMAELRKQLNACPQRTAYYPGSEAKYQKFRNRMGPEKIVELGVSVPTPEGGCGCSPWLLAEGLTPDTALGRQENWCGVLQEVALPPAAGAAPGDAASFLQRAQSYVNDQLWGSLAAAVWVHPKTKAEVGAEAWTQFLAGLRYGNICVNLPAVMGFVVTGLPWGAAPGNTLADIESGVGFVHNTWLFDHAQKGVLTGPWRSNPTPLHFGDNYAVPHIAPSLLRFSALLDNPVLAMPSMLAVAAAAVRG